MLRDWHCSIKTYIRPVLQFVTSTGTSSLSPVDGLPDFASIVALFMLDFFGLVLADPSNPSLTKIF